MNIDSLVESIVAPFLEESEYTEPLTPISSDNSDNYPLGKKLNECDIIRNLLSVSSIPAIQNISSALETPEITSFLNDSPEASSFVSDNMEDAQSDDWATRNIDMADKIGYDIVDYIDGANETREVSVTLDDDSTFMDRSGRICESFSYRQKIRNIISENLKKKD